MKLKPLFLILGILLLINLINALPPFSEQSFTEGYVIEIPAHNNLVFNQSYEFNFHIYNISNGIPITSGVQCIFHLYNTTGSHIVYLTNSIPSPIYDYKFIINAGNFSTNGEYYYNIQCNSSTLGGFSNANLIVTPNGEPLTEARLNSNLGLLVLLVLFLILIIITFISFDNMIVRVGMFGLGYLLTAGIMFVAWTIAQDFITTQPFLIYMFKWVFIIMMIAIFPLLTLFFGLYLYLIFTDKKIYELIRKGVSPEEADRRIRSGKFV